LCELLDRHRELVAQEFDTLLGGNGEKECNGGAARQKPGQPRPSWTAC
jgi:hypothetical protein